MKQDDPQFKLRIPPALKEKLEQAAQENTRTMGAEIVARLQASFGVKTLDNVKMFAKPVSEPAASTEPAHPLLSRVAGDDCAFARLDQKKEVQAMIEDALKPYMLELIESVAQERKKLLVLFHTGDLPPKPSTQTAPTSPKTKRLR